MSDRHIFRLSGPDARSFLQGLITNDIAKLKGGGVYAALLTPQGKYLCDFFLLDGGGGDVLIDVSVAQAPVLAQKLQMYGLRRKAAVSVEQGCEIALAWGGNGEVLAGDGAVADPRDPALGWRRYGPDATGWLTRHGIASVTASERDAVRIARVIPESGVELVPDDTYILEAGFERLSGVDFSKGCYVGQEVTARTKYRGLLRRRLAPVTIDGAPAEGETRIMADGRDVGELRAHAGGQGLALLKLETIASGQPLTCGGAAVTAHVPDWWRLPEQEAGTGSAD